MARRHFFWQAYGLAMKNKEIVGFIGSLRYFLRRSLKLTNLGVQPKFEDNKELRDKLSA